MYTLNQSSFAYGNRFGAGGFNPAQGGYLPNAGQGGFMAQGGYMDQAAQGGYMPQGGYMNEQSGNVNAAAQQQQQEAGYTRPQELPVETYNFSSEPQQQQ
jgi:hypothetical protein